MKKALVTGVFGQDGSYLVPLLLDKDYEVHTISQNIDKDREISFEKFCNGRKVIFHYGDICDRNCIATIMNEVVPDEVYNLAAQSQVSLSFKFPKETTDVNYFGAGNVINEALNTNPQTRVYQASTSEMFGNSPAPQSELTPFNPQSPYAEAKMRAHQDFIVNKRQTQNAYTVSGFLFNHESPRRGKQFVTRKITYSLAKIAAGLQDHLELGNLDAKRDWGLAGDYVEAMYLMLQQEKPEDFVIATGAVHTIREFVDIAASYFNIDIFWDGQEEKEIGYDKKTGKVLVKVNPEFYRPREVNFIQGDATKAKAILGWTPKHSFTDLVKMMAEADRTLVEKGE